MRRGHEQTLNDIIENDIHIRRTKKPPKRLLEYDPTITLKKVNDGIKDMGYEYVYYGHDLLTGFLYYEIVPIKAQYGVPEDRWVRVYALGDLTPEQWRLKLWYCLGQTKGQKPDLHQRTYRRIRANKYGYYR